MFFNIVILSTVEDRGNLDSTVKNQYATNYLTVEIRKNHNSTVGNQYVTN